MYAHKNTHKDVHTYTLTSLKTHLCMETNTFSHTVNPPDALENMHVRGYIYISVHTYRHVYTHTHTHRVYVHVYTFSRP